MTGVVLIQRGQIQKLAGHLRGKLFFALLNIAALPIAGAAFAAETTGPITIGIAGPLAGPFAATG